jgi:site-specific recombinase XerC
MENEIKERECRCLYDFAEHALEKYRKTRMDELNEILEIHFAESRTANCELSQLNDVDINKLIIHTAIHYAENKKSWIQFVSMLQIAVILASNELGKNFRSCNNMQENCRKTACKYINMPYTAEEKHKLSEWINHHNSHDMQMLAVDFWLTGGISTKEIAGLKKKWMLDSEGKYNSTHPVVLKKSDAHWYLQMTQKRYEIIQKALKIQEKKGIESEYIFVSGEKDGWKKLPFLSVQKRLSEICKKLGIKYHPCKINEAASWKIE